jgi:hypothetical protein
MEPQALTSKIQLPGPLFLLFRLQLRKNDTFVTLPHLSWKYFFGCM